MGKQKNETDFFLHIVFVTSHTRNNSIHNKHVNSMYEILRDDFRQY